MSRRSPEHTETAVPIRREMEHAGFRRGRTSGVKATEGRFHAVATTGLFDDYWYHPLRGLSLWVDYKRRQGGRISPAQAAFLAAHAHNPTRAYVWSDPAECVEWLEARWLRLVLPDGTIRYPFGLHAPVIPSTEEETWDS